MLSPSSLLAGALALAATASASPLTARQSAAPSATIQNGTVTGVTLPTFSQEAFLGIPYAQPPVGDLRLRRAKSIEKGFEGGVYEAKEYSPFCPGVGGDNLGFKMSEDCLTVNVVRPEGVSEGDNLPVGFWIYGGGFQMGGNADQRYNTSYMIQRSVEMEKPIISVHVNYRTAALGFMTSKEIKAEGNENLGIYDQRLALHWVQENIAAFGGDPTKVTIWGESAGAISVAYQLNAYALDETPLFRGAILESGNAHTIAFLPIEESQESFDAVAKGTGCADSDDVLKCIRGLSLEEFNNTASAYSFNPVVDGGIISSYASDQYTSGNYAKVPLLLGANTDEGASLGTSGINTTSQLIADLQKNYPDLTDESAHKIAELYPDDPLIGCPYNTGDLILPSGKMDKRSFSIWGDLRFHAGRRELAELYSQSQPVYSYRYDQPAENATVSQGVQHFVEVAPVFGYPFKTANTLGTRPGDAELSHLMQSQWISFIHDQTPNNHGVADAPSWPNYQDSASNYVFRRHGSEVEDDTYRKEGIELMNSLGWQVRA
ncbi:hypothetical protein JCM6882_003868 [Rhodosporidiobolus microsporus]